jgi:5-formyltetrahydrofolate cyclo-ligase
MVPMTAADPDLVALKKQARADAAERRARAHAAAATSAGFALATTGLGFSGAAEGATVAGFLAYRTEIDVLPLMARLVADGATTALPVVTGKGQPLVFRRWHPGEPLEEAHFGIHVPPATAEEVEPDVLLVPMLAFDREGYRLGYGGGFYDRTLERLRAMKPVTAIGVAFAGQEVAQVMRGAHDQPLDFILTESGVIRPVRG